MQNNNYYKVPKETGVVTTGVAQTTNLYANFLKSKQSIAQQPSNNKQDQKLLGYLVDQKNQGKLSRQQTQTIPNRPSITQTNIARPQIERISISFQKQTISKQQCLNDESNQILDKLNTKQPTLKEIILIQSYYRKRLAQKVFKQLQKRQKYRRSIVSELVTTEKQYLTDLQLMCHVQNELKQKCTTDAKIIGANEIKSLFQNLDAIQGLSETMVESLQIIQLKFDGITKIGNQMKQFASFFKFYFEYCNNYVQAQKLYNSLKKDNSKFKQFIQQVEKTQLKGSPFENFLIKPVQRVPKYVLLLKDLLKNTVNTHCDYKNIENSLEQFIKVNDDNNKNMDKLITNQKIFELQKQFGNAQVMIVDAKREFKSEESLKIFYNHEARPVIVYFLTDLLLVTEREEKDQKFNYKLLKYIYLDQYSYGQELDDFAHISYLFRLIGKNETVTFIADNSENKQKFIDYINKLISGIRQNQANRQQAFEVFDKLQVKGEKPINQAKHPVLVNILGTQEVYESSVKTFTQYIISVEIANIQQKIFIRFSNFLEIQKQIQTQFPKLQLPYCKDQKWIGNHDVKVIEGRKIQMMNFLQTLLTAKQMLTEGEEILIQLGLPFNFYQLPEILEAQPKNIVENTHRKNQHPISNNQNPTRSSVFQSYYNTEKDAVRSGVKQSGHMGGLISPRLKAELSPRLPIKAIHDEVFEQCIAETLQLKKPIATQIAEPITTQAFPRSNSQMQKKYSATKIARGSVPINSVRGSLVRNDSTKEILIVKMKVQILTFPKVTEIEVSISPESRGTDAFEDVILQVNLQSGFDFKLYIKEKNGERPIEDDELLWTLLVEKSTVQSTTQKISQFVKRGTTQHSYSYNLKPVTLKKHLYLPEENEREHYEDSKRVELLSQQSLMEITSYQLKLNDTEYIMFTALKLYLDGVKDVNLQKIPFEKIQEFLPINVYKTLPKDNWQFLLPDMLKNFEDEVKAILSGHEPIRTSSESQSPVRERQRDSMFLDLTGTEQEPSQLFKQLTGSDFEDDPEIVRLSIGQMVFLKLISQTQFYGFRIFELTPDKESRMNLQKLCQDQFRDFLSRMSKSAQNQEAPQLTGVKILLCVGFNSINIYSNYQQKRPLVSLNYEDINQVKAHPQSLLIQLQPQLAGTSFQVKKSILLHFETIQSFVIQMLIQEYQEVRTTIEDEDQCEFTQVDQ